MATATAAPPVAARAEDQRVTLYDVSWADFELMSPSVDHEGIKKAVARLLEAYAEERGLPLQRLRLLDAQERAPA